MDTNNRKKIIKAPNYRKKTKSYHKQGNLKDREGLSLKHCHSRSIINKNVFQNESEIKASKQQ